MFLLCAVRCALVLKCYKVFCCALILDSLQSFLLNVRSVLLQNFLLCADALILKMSCWTLANSELMQSFLLCTDSRTPSKFSVECWFWLGYRWAFNVTVPVPIEIFNFNELIIFFNALCLLFIMLKKIIN